MARYELNDERNGIEIYFDSVPSEEIRTKLRESGWRWFKAKKCWYTKQSEEAIGFAKEICGGDVSASHTKQPASFVMPEMKNRFLRPDFDQLAAYAKDLKEYHFESRNRDILAMLVITKMSNKESEKNGISICSGDKLEKILLEKVKSKVTVCNLEQWINSRYEPLPTIVDAARMIMKKEELPT